MMVRHGLDMSKLQKVRKQSILMTMPFRRNIGNYANYIDIENGINIGFRTEKGREQSSLGRTWKDYD